VGGIFSSAAVFALFIIVLLIAPQGLFGAPTARRV
jgi:branched-chain amino acid transport system permease protein